MMVAVTLPHTCDVDIGIYILVTIIVDTLLPFYRANFSAWIKKL
jgi:hypothetical protein